MLNANELRNSIIEKSHAPSGVVAISAVDGNLIVNLQGFAPGTSLSYAARRRRIIKKIVRECAEQLSLRPLVSFNWGDGITRTETMIKALLQSSLGTEPETVSVTVGKSSAVDVYVTFKDPLPEKVSYDQQIRSLIEAQVKGAGGRMRQGGHVGGLHVSFPGSMEARPTLAELLRSVRVLQPTSIEQLIAYWAHRGTPGLSPALLNSQLDVARQRGLVTQMKGKLFAVTAQGIAANGSTKGRTSPDIERNLALGRRTSYS